MPPSIYDLSLAELEAVVARLGARPYRARQAWAGLYGGLATDWDGIPTLPAALRASLAAELPFPTIETAAERRSDDGQTIKRLFRLHDGKLIESVLMLYDPRDDARGRATVCVSSQAGCAMGCIFCATGQGGFERNLSAAEIVAQVISFARSLREDDGRRITNVVFMGMGEPMANYGAVLRAASTIADPRGLDLAARHITISTVGHVAGIRKLAREQLQLGLAVSLHAPDDALRQRLIPTATRYPLAEIIAACRDYIARTSRRVTFEYCLIAGVNDAPGQARALAARIAGLNCHVNLIPVNPTPDEAIRRPGRARTLAFERELRRLHIPCTVRAEKGVEISAACGQLRAAAPLPLIATPPRKMVRS